MHALQAIDHYLTDNGFMTKYWAGSNEEKMPPRIEIVCKWKVTIGITIVDNNIEARTVTMANGSEIEQWYCSSKLRIPLAQPDAIEQLAKHLAQQLKIDHTQHREIVKAIREASEA